jgi:hypothetical protein
MITHTELLALVLQPVDLLYYELDT